MKESKAMQAMTGYKHITPKDNLKTLEKKLQGAIANNDLDEIDFYEKAVVDAKARL